MTFEQLILSRFPKPSDLFAFLADVIRNPPANFEWNMDTYGYLDEGSKCVGCAATSAVLKMTGKDGGKFEKEFDIRASWLNLSKISDLIKLEDFFDKLRCGGYWEAKAVFGPLPFPAKAWRFFNENEECWPLNLANLEEYVAHLKEKNL